MTKTPMKVKLPKRFVKALWIPVTEEIADQVATYMAQYSKMHGLTLAEALIAATAKVMGARLVTLDRDFFPTTDLQVYVPY